MSSKIYDALAVHWAAVLLDGYTYAALHYEVPTQTDPGASEITGPSYSRAICSWDDTTSPRLLSNVQALEWQNLNEDTVIGVGIWTQPTGGDLWVFAQFEGDGVYIPDRTSYVLGASTVWVSI